MHARSFHLSLSLLLPLWGVRKREGERKSAQTREYTDMRPRIVPVMSTCVCLTSVSVYVSYMVVRFYTVLHREFRARHPLGDGFGGEV
jgi:hypothetical protein